MRAAISALISATAVLAQPEQVHLSLTADPTAVAVDFVAPADAAGVTATYGNPAKNAAVDCVTQTLNTYKAQFCTAVFGPGLAANTVYSYTLTAGGKAFTTNFTNQPARDPIYAVYADFGLGNDLSLSRLIADSEAGGFDYVIHAGDWAYDFDSGNSAVGNGFMNSIQPYAARRPYMGSAGNHEAYGTQGGGEFAQFVLRNRALAENVGKSSGSNSNLWYSFETPHVHWIAFCAESWTMSAGQLAQQKAWMTQDLSSVDRARTPWVIAFSHKAWQMDSTTWSMFDVLAEYKVDLHIVGHWHQYTRYPPIDSRNNTVVIDTASMSADKSVYTNPKYPTLVVAGAPGDGEVNPATCAEQWSIYCSGNYGYGLLQVNATAIHWHWFTTVPVKGSPNPTFSDELFIVKK